VRHDDAGLAQFVEFLRLTFNLLRREAQAVYFSSRRSRKSTIDGRALSYLWTINGGTASCCPSGDCPKESEQAACQESGSWVNVFYRSYSDDVTDKSRGMRKKVGT